MVPTNIIINRTQKGHLIILVLIFSDILALTASISSVLLLTNDLYKSSVFCKSYLTLLMVTLYTNRLWRQSAHARGLGRSN